MLSSKIMLDFDSAGPITRKQTIFLTNLSKMKDLILETGVVPFLVVVLCQKPSTARTLEMVYCGDEVLVDCV